MSLGTLFVTCLLLHYHLFYVKCVRYLAAVWQKCEYLKHKAHLQMHRFKYLLHKNHVLLISSIYFP